MIKLVVATQCTGWFAPRDTGETYSAFLKQENAMVMYSVTMGRPGGGSGTISVLVSALTPGMARTSAMAQYPQLSVHAIKVAR